MQTEQATSAQTFKRLRGYLSHYKLAFFVAILGNLAYGGMEFLFAYSLEPLTDEALVNGNMSTIQAAPFFIMAILCVRGLAGFISSYCMSWVGQSIVQKIQQQMISKYLMLPCAFLDQTTTGRLVSKITFDTQQVASATTDTFTKLIREGGLVIFIVCYLFATSWQLAGLFLISAPLIGLAVNAASKRFKKISKNIQSAMGGVTQNSQEIVDGYKVIKTYGGKDFEEKRFQVEAKNNRIQNTKMVATKAISTTVIQLLAGVSLSLVIYFAGKQLASEELKPGEFVTMLAMMMLMLKPLKILSNLNSVLQKGIAGAQSIFEILDQGNELDEGTRVLENIQGRVEFDHVEFSYDQNKPILRQVSFVAEPGQTIALVGRSGSGKSTITNLLLRFYDPSSGSITIDGFDSKTISLTSLRGQASYVSQHVTLFNTTVARNIAYGENEIDLERIKQAAVKAHATEFIEKLPDGFNQEIGENGMRLSGGQRQRLAIARAIYKDSAIVILDEATSALDTESERHIQQAFDRLTSNRTTIVIAHRLSTIEQADMILVMDDGEIVERGNHTSLMAMNGYYTKLYQMQFDEDKSQ
jgi:subfamily B ATP-binding cassette protein MsbA